VFQPLVRILESDDVSLRERRSLSGKASSLRTQLIALAQHASESGPKTSFDLAAVSLEELNIWLRRCRADLDNSMLAVRELRSAGPERSAELAQQYRDRVAFLETASILSSQMLTAAGETAEDRTDTDAIGQVDAQLRALETAMADPASEPVPVPEIEHLQRIWTDLREICLTGPGRVTPELAAAELAMERAKTRIEDRQEVLENLADICETHQSLVEETQFLESLTSATAATIIESPFFCHIRSLMGDEFPLDDEQRFRDLVVDLDSRAPGWRLPGQPIDVEVASLV
jgi:hypothetical protein